MNGAKSMEFTAKQNLVGWGSNYKVENDDQKKKNKLKI